MSILKIHRINTSSNIILLFNSGIMAKINLSIVATLKGLFKDTDLDKIETINNIIAKSEFTNKPVDQLPEVLNGLFPQYGQNMIELRISGGLKETISFQEAKTIIEADK